MSELPRQPLLIHDRIIFEIHRQPETSTILSESLSRCPKFGWEFLLVLTVK
jgi:hypothetical protein